MEIKKSGDIRIVIIGERLDAYNAKDADGAIKTLIENGIRKIICDFSQTEYIASAGLRVLLSATKSLQKLTGQLIICSLRPYVKEVFDTVGFTQLFKLYDSTEEAVGHLS